MKLNLLESFFNHDKYQITPSAKFICITSALLAILHLSSLSAKCCNSFPQFKLVKSSEFILISNTIHLISFLSVYKNPSHKKTIQEKKLVIRETQTEKWQPSEEKAGFQSPIQTKTIQQKTTVNAETQTIETSTQDHQTSNEKSAFQSPNPNKKSKNVVLGDSNNLGLSITPESKNNPQN
ncbi:MAG: hypothetical protein ACOVOR_05515 [Rhabdochlamydiaceae bacterium]